MGAGQIGGVATLLDIDFDNPAGFLGVRAEPTEAQHVVYFLSHALMFCVGALIEAHVVLTPASCVVGERFKFEVFGGTHKFVESFGVTRLVHHLSIHRGYNHSKRWSDCPPECSPDNLALLVLNKQFKFHKREPDTEFLLNRVRYGIAETKVSSRYTDTTCRFYGWGSRRNGYLIPLLIDLRRMDVKIMPAEKCTSMWNYQNKYLCIEQAPCKDDVGSLIICSGFAQGMMTSHMVDRPCGVGFLDLTMYNKFLTCGVDDSRDVIDDDEPMFFEFATAAQSHPTISLATPSTDPGSKCLSCGD